MILNLGAGYDIRNEAINLDRRRLPGIDVVHDLDVHPYPILDDQFVEILALDVFEHIADVVGAMDECWRLLKPGGQMIVRGPSVNSPNLWSDVTHRRAFAPHAFDHFDWSTELGSKYRYGAHSWKVISCDERDPAAIVFVLEPVKDRSPS